MHSSHELGTPPSSVQWPFQLSVAFLAVTASRHPKLSHRLQPPLKAANLRSGSRLPFSKASNLRRASIHEPLGGPKVLSYGFETASCPPRKSFKSSAAPRACPRSKTSAAPPACPPQQLQQKKNFHPRVAGLPQSLFLRFRDRRLPALETFKSSAAPRTSTVPPSTSRSVAPKSFLTVSRPPPAPLESFKSSAAPRACPRSKTSAAPPACPPQQLQQKPPSTSRWVAANLFLRFRDRLPPSKASNPPQRLEPAPLQPVPLNSSNKPLGGRKVFSYGFETAACPPRKLQILRSASSLPPSAARALLRSLKPPRRALPSVPSSV